MNGIFVKDGPVIVPIVFYLGTIKVPGIDVSRVSASELIKPDGSIVTPIPLTIQSAANASVITLSGALTDTAGLNLVHLSGKDFDPVDIRFQLTDRDINEMITDAELKAEVAALSGSIRNGLSATVNAMQLSAVYDIWEINKAFLTASNSIGDLLRVNIDEALSAIKTVVDSNAVEITAIQGTGFASATDSLKQLQVLIDTLPTTTLSGSAIQSAVWNPQSSSFEVSGSMGEIMKYIMGYTGGKRDFNETTNQETMYKPDKSTVIDTFDITLDADDEKILTREPV